MRSLVRISAILSPLLLVWVWWSFVRAPSSNGPKLDATYTNAAEANANDFHVSFRYPKEWTLQVIPHDPTDVAVFLMPPEGRVMGTAITFIATRDAKLIAMPKPIVPPGATVHSKGDSSLAGSLAIVAEASVIAPNGMYSRNRSWQTTVEGRHVACSGTVSGLPANSADVDRRFEQYRATFEAVAASVRIKGR